MTETIDPLELARALIRCPSVTPEDNGALDVLHQALEGLGFACHRLTFCQDGTPDVDNLYARAGEGGPNFCFAGHTDVVPPGDDGAWTHKPFAGEVADGRLYGRGAADMKGAVACFAAAASRYLADSQGNLDGSISLLITGDEEGPAVNGTVKVLEWLAEEGETPDACLVGEPTNPEVLGEVVKIGRRGSLNGVLTVHGIQGHAAYPELADNPIPRLMRMMTVLNYVALDEGNSHFQPSKLTITSLDADNIAANVIPPRASAAFNIRFNDSHDGKSLEAWIREHCDKEEIRYDLALEVTAEAFLTPPGPLSDIVSGAVERITGRRPELSTSGGTSDARFIKDHCPVAEFGLTGGTVHQVDENVAVDDVAKLADIYLAVIEDFFAETRC